jgi:HD-like signal output (HDOD) protein
VNGSKSSAPRKEEQGSSFEFVTMLAKELSDGRIELPSFPDAAARLQQVLSNEDVSSERIARVVSSDGGLAGRILTMANSTLLHRGSTPVTDLKVAITRIGHENIRTAALTYATAQLRRAPEHAHIREELEKCWLDGIRVAAFAHALAKESGSVRTDEALLAGLLHNMGKVYIIARTPKPVADGPVIFNEDFLNQWHPGIGQALVENWHLPEGVAAAVGGQLDLDRSHGGPPDLQDLLILSVKLATQVAQGNADDTSLGHLPAASSLGLDDAAFVRVMLESQTDLELLQAALG